MNGSTSLNGAGDRKGGNHDFWAVQEGVDGPFWQIVARYVVASDRTDSLQVNQKPMEEGPPKLPETGGYAHVTGAARMLVWEFLERILRALARRACRTATGFAP